MKIKIVSNYKELSKLAADKVQAAIKQNPASVLVFPTGNTPLGLFEELVKQFELGLIDFSCCSLIELDEYYDIAKDDKRSLFGWLERSLINRVNFNPSNIFRFDSATPEPQAECERIERIIMQLGGIDLLVLGLGRNGHLGFNEPGSSFDSKTRLIELSSASIESNARYWGSQDDVLRQGLTLGLKTLSSSRETIVLVSGQSKSEILRKVLDSPPDPQLPATILESFNHVTVIVDQAGAQHLGRNSGITPTKTER